MKIRNMTTLHLRKSIGRLPWALAVCLTLATLGLGLSANAQARTPTFTTFDAPGAGTGPGHGTFITYDPPGKIGSVAQSINPAGAIAGPCRDASQVHHGYLRAPDGTFTI